MTLHLILKTHHLVLTNNNGLDGELNFLGNDDLITNWEGINHLLVIRNSKNQVTGFEVNGERVMHLKFNKIE